MADLTTRYIADDAPITSFSALVPLLELKAEADSLLSGSSALPRLDWQSATLAQISTAFKVTVSQSRHTIRNYTDATSGDLVAIIGDIDVLVLNLANASKTTTIRHNATFAGGGRKIYTHDGRDVVLNEQNRTVVLFYNSAQTCYSTDVRAMGSVWWNAAADATLAADALTATQSKLKIITEGGAVVDELATISNPNALDVVVLAVKNVGYTVTVKHGVGNVWFESGTDYTLDSQDDCLVLYWDTTNSRWTAPAFTNNYTISVKSPLTAAVSATQLEHLTLKTPSIPITTKMLLTASLPSRRKSFIVQPRTGTTIDTLGLTFTATGTAGSEDNSFTHYAKFTQPASTNTYASYISNEAPFNVRYSPSLDYEYFSYSVVNPYSAMSGKNPRFIGFMTALPTFTGAVDGLGNITSYTYTFTGISGFFVFDGALSIYDNGTNVTPAYTATSSIPGFNWGLKTRIGFSVPLGIFIYETYSNYSKTRFFYPLSPSSNLLTANLKLVVAHGHYYASNAYFSMSVLCGEQD